MKKCNFSFLQFVNGQNQATSWRHTLVCMGFIYRIRSVVPFAWWVVISTIVGLQLRHSLMVRSRADFDVWDLRYDARRATAAAGTTTTTTTAAVRERKWLCFHHLTSPAPTEVGAAADWIAPQQRGERSSSIMFDSHRQERATRAAVLPYRKA